MLINERFKSPNKEFEKVFNLFRKKDYFDEKSQVKKKQEEFVRFLKKGDPMATKVFKQNKEDMKSSLSFIEDMVMDYNKKNHFEAFQIFSKAVNNVEMKDSKSAENSGKFIKSKIHNNSQKYSLAIYSAIRKQKFNNYKDVHKDVDELISKNEGYKLTRESVNEVSDSEIKKIIKKKEKGGPYTVVVQKGSTSKHISHAKDVGDSVDKAIKVYHQFKKKHRNGVQIIDGYGRTVFFESVNEAKYFSLKKGDKLKVKHPQYKNLIFTIIKPKGSGYEYIAKHTRGTDKNWAPAGYFSSAIKRKDAELIESVNEAKPKLNANQIMEKLAKKSKSFKDFVKAMYNESSFRNSKYWRFRKDKAILDWFQKVYNSVNESVPQGYNPMVEDKKQIKDLVKKVKHEKLFYDVLNTMEKKFGKNKYRIWLEKSLKGFGVNPKHYDYRTNAGAEEKLFQLGK